jgi:hypothetical protein
MSGFAHDIAGGSGDLVISQLQSPNFSIAGQTGWAILKDGDAYFYSVTIPGGTGTKVTFSATAPPGPDTGDLWYNTSAGLEVSQWNGSAWVAYQIGAGALETGIIVAGIVNSTTVNAATFTGSTFMGTDFIINTTGAFYYTGTPAANNLSTSSVPGTSGGTDGFGNHYLPGEATYGSGFATSLNAGYMAFYTGSLPAGWTFVAQLSTDSGGDLIMETASGTLELSAAGNVSISGNLTVSGTFSASGDTGTAGLPNGTISGTSGSASAGTAHTHGAGSYAVTDGVHSHTL